VKRLLLPVAGIAALVSAVAALAAPLAVNQWWFLRSKSSLPAALHAPAIVARGSWSRHPWELVAYPAKAGNNAQLGTYGPMLCWGVTFPVKHPPEKRPAGYMIGGGYVAMHTPDDAMACGSTVGIETKQKYVPTKPPVKTELWINQTANGYPSWLAATVPASTTHVVVLWSALKAAPGRPARPREVVRPHAFLAHVAGYRVRVFAVPLARAVSRTSPLPTITATNRHGRTVARFP
jgi:hypothetical protein